MAKDFWKHGKYIDLWSIVHFLSGTLVASLAYWLELPFFWATVIAIVGVLGWEFVEAATRIIESKTNVIMDIIIGLAGFFFASYLYFIQNLFFSPWIFSGLVLLTGVLSLWGFIDFLKKGYR